METRLDTLERRLRASAQAVLLASAAALSVFGCVAVAPPGGETARRGDEFGSDAGTAASASGTTCEEEQEGYASYQSQIAGTLGGANCDVDGDCRLVVVSNLCNQGCGAAFAARVATAIEDDLNDYAATHCTACEASTDVCPATELVPFCTGGVCSAH